jgi:hypothetical protein
MKNVEIISGDIGSVRNQLRLLINDKVHEILSLTQSQITTNHLTIVLIYTEKNNSKSELDYKP